MLEKIPQDLIPSLFKYLTIREISIMSMICTFFKSAAYDFLYPKEWKKDSFDEEVSLYVRRFNNFNAKDINQIKEWSVISKQNKEIPRYYWVSKEKLDFENNKTAYYAITLPINTLIRSKGFFPNNPKNNYASNMGVSPANIHGYLYKEGNTVIELKNPFYAKNASTSANADPTSNNSTIHKP